MTRQKIAYCSLLVLLFGAGCIRGLAQSAAAGDACAARMAENNESLKQYVHLQKTEVSWKGKVRSTQFAEINYDEATGKEISVPLGSTSSNQSQARAQGFIMRRVSQHIANNIKDDAQRLADLRSQYLPPSPTKIKAALPRAEIGAGSGGETKITFTDYVQPGDTMILSVNPNMKVPAQIEIHSSLDGQPVSFSVDFASLSDGLFYPAAASMKWEARHLELNISNFEYRK